MPKQCAQEIKGALDWMQNNNLSTGNDSISPINKISFIQVPCGNTESLAKVEFKITKQHAQEIEGALDSMRTTMRQSAMFLFYLSVK